LEASTRGPAEELVTTSARILIQSLASPSALCSVVESLEGAKPKKISAKGLEFIATANLIGYETWPLFVRLLSAGLRAYLSDALLGQLRRAAQTWRRQGVQHARMKALTRLLTSHRGTKDKMLVFAGFPGVAREVSAQLRQTFGEVNVVDFRWELSREEKEDNVLRFQNDPSTWLMVSDETGGEGRNFQFAAELVHFDNPWSAARVEQRIGRLDRLGREKYRKDTTSNILYNSGSVEAGLIRCYTEGLRVYSESISGLEFALRDIELLLARRAIEAQEIDEVGDLSNEIRDVASRERGQQESEAVLDEASFNAATASKYSGLLDLGHLEREIEETFVDYFRCVSSKNSAKRLDDVHFPGEFWRFNADDVRYGVRNSSGASGVWQGSFHRQAAQSRLSLDFFNIGNPFFDWLYNSLSVASTGRVYAIACAVPGEDPWKGFEFLFGIQPAVTADNEFATLARDIVSVRPVHLFYTEDGDFEEQSQRFEEIRKMLAIGGDRLNWRNLGDARSGKEFSVMSLHWQEALKKACGDAERRVREAVSQRVDEVVRAQQTKLTEAERYLSQTEGSWVVDEIRSLRALCEATEQWRVELDSVGFLAINTAI